MLSMSVPVVFNAPSRKELSTNFLVLSGFTDYFDYYWNEGIRIGYIYNFNKRNVMFAVNLNLERHDSLKPTAFEALNGKSGSMRMNPAVKEGNLNSIVLDFSWGQKHKSLAIAGIKGVVFTIESSPSKVLDSDFSYTQYRTDINWRAITYLKRRLFPMTLDLHFSGSTSSGVLPIQRYGSIDSKFLLWTPFGSFRSLGDRPLEGEHHAALFLEHNLRTVPFELIGLRSIVEKNIGIIIHGAAGRTWISKNKINELLYNPHYYNHVVSEAGISLNGIMGILRIDATKRLDKRGYSIGVNIARIM